MPTIFVTPSAADESIGSGFGGELSYSVTLSEAALDPVSVSYRIFPGTALIDIDVPTVADTLVFAPGETTKPIQFDAISDLIAETDESLVLEFFNAVGGDLDGGAPTLKVTNFIEDDDGVGGDRALFVSSPTYVEGDSGSTMAVFVVSVSEAFSSITNFDYRTEDGTATAGSDYTATTGVITFAPGLRSVQVEVPVFGDTQIEPSEYFRLVIDTDSSIDDGGIGAVGEATLLDDDAGGSEPTLSFSVENVPESIGSGFGGLVIVTARLSEPSLDAVSVKFRVLNDTAQTSIDFPLTEGEFVFDPGETVHIETFRVNSDTIDEADESFVVELFNSTGATFAGGYPVLRETGFVLDDDGTGLDLGLHVSSPVLIEGDSGAPRALFDITLSTPSSVPLTFDYATQDAGAVAGSDYIATFGSVTFAPGQTRTTIEVEVISDEVPEFTEALQLVVTPTVNLGDDGIGAVGEAVILDDDTGGALPTFSVVSGARDPIVVSESIGSGFGGTATFTVMLSEPPTDLVTVNYRTVPGTAQSEIDFPRTNGTLEFAPGQQYETVNIRVFSDNIDEDDESFFLEFFDIEGGVFAGGVPVLQEAAFIIDDDGVGLDRSLQVSSPVLLEGDDASHTARFEVVLSRPSDTELTFAYTTQDGSAQAGSDYTATSGSLTFAPGQTSAFVDVAVSGDIVAEVSEFFQLVITPTTALGDDGAGAVGQAVLLDDDGLLDLPTISVSSSDARESIGSGFGGTIDWVVTLSEPMDDAVTVEYRSVDRTAVGETDFPEFSGTLTFAPGQTSLTFSQRVTSDSLDEADESLAIELFDPSGAVLAGGVAVLQEAAFILDDDGVGLDRTVHVSDVQIFEPFNGTGTATFEVRISRPFDVETTLDYRTFAGSASAGSDYVAQTGSLTFAPGQTEAAVNVTVNSDSINESSETFLLSLDAPLPSTLTGAPEGSLGTATILAPVAPPLPPEGEVDVTGLFNVSQILTADASNLTDENGLGDFSYQWLRDGQMIPLATSLTYTVQQGDLYASLQVRVSYIDGLGVEESVTSIGDAVGLALATVGDDTIQGGDQNDRIEGDTGNDLLQGGGGNDGLLGGEGNDTMFGGDGNDRLPGAGGDDEIFGEDGNDRLGGGDGNDLMDGGAGNDGGGAGPGNDTVMGGDGNDRFNGGFGTDLLDLGEGDDTSGGSFGNDTMLGGGGDDLLGGANGQDSIDGGAGDDTIISGFGNDTVTGGSGADVFVFNSLFGGGTTVITDFEDGIDLIRVIGLRNPPDPVARLDITDITVDGQAAVEMSYGDHTIIVLDAVEADFGTDDFLFS